MPARRQPAWRKDPKVLLRLPDVERQHLSGLSNVAIATALGVDEKTVRNDLERIRELWVSQVSDTVSVLKAQAIAELEDVRRRAIAAAEFDEAAERAVLYGEDARVVRDERGKAEFRGQKAQALNVARQASMDKAKVLGIIVEREEHQGEVLIRQYVGIAVEAV
jgi:hypothetical protein